MQYNDLIYNSGPVSVKDYVSNKYNIVHNKLYEDALHNYVYEYAKKIIMKDIFYNLFSSMNNCITLYNDEFLYEPESLILRIVNLDKINELKNGELYKVFKLEEIKNENLINDDYINLLLDYTNSDERPYKSSFNNAFKLLCIDKDKKYQYINYIIVNLVSLLDDVKNNIIEVQSNRFKSISINNFSDFIIRYKNSLYIVDEETGLTLFNTENSSNDVLDVNDINYYNEIFIYEEQYKMDYHIGFNEGGYFILDIDESVDIRKNYEKLYYIISYVNYLLLNLLLELIVENYLKSNTILERAQSEYYLPSSIIIYSNTYPHTKTLVDLSPYWSDYNDHSDIYVEDIKIINEPINDFEIEDINYIDGSMKVYSRMHDINYNIPKKYINENFKINDELINNTFIQKI